MALSPIAEQLLSHVFGGQLGAAFASPLMQRTRHKAGHVMQMLKPIAVDVDEEEKTYLVKADLPGVEKSQLSVHVDDDRMLHISINEDMAADTDGKAPEGEAEEGPPSKYPIHHLAERHTVFAERSLRLPVDADVESVNAKMENGVLHVTIAKKEMADTKRSIEVA